MLIINENAFIDLKNVMLDFYNVVECSKDNMVIIIGCNATKANNNKSYDQSFHVIEGASIEDAIYNFNHSADHDVMFDKDQGWFVFYAQDV